jgi:hypothetical protein
MKKKMVMRKYVSLVSTDHIELVNLFQHAKTSQVLNLLPPRNFLRGFKEFIG